MVHTQWFRILVCLLVLCSLQGLRSCSRTADPSSAEGACPAATLRWRTKQNAGERRLSRYDYLLKKYAARMGMDWRLLAAIVYHESKFNEQALSPVGAKGLMQLRDVAALHYGMPEADLYDPETNILLGTTLLDDLFDQFRKEGISDEDVLRFALASYNVGGGALARRRAEADSLGLDPNSWSAVATIFDREDHSTPAYIDAVEQTYQRYCQRY
jgi:membrane-bound lytic murein transglycosylase F